MNQAFFQPLHQILLTAVNLWHCPELPDDVWLQLGVQRVLEGCSSGRAFLQEHGLRFARPPKASNYFASLRSARRGELLHEVNQSLLAALEARLPDRLAAIPELAGYACFAADGHWHQAATHDVRHEGRKLPVGHFYSLNLHTHTLRHLTAGEGLHEHDMSALKRIKPTGLRQGVPAGTRVLLVYDKAGIDLAYWQRCRQECAVYFLSRAKENMVFAWVADRPWDRTDPRQHGVVADYTVQSRDGHRLRLIWYQDAASGQVYEYLTNEPDLSPGVLAELYRRRWEAEKVFDEMKNKLGQTKAWGTSLTARTAQAQLIALTHNLLVGYEQELAQRHGVTNTAEDRRRRQRQAAAQQACAGTGSPLTSLAQLPREATERSVKFLRWLRAALQIGLAEALAVPHLKTFYATL